MVKRPAFAHLVKRPALVLQRNLRGFAVTVERTRRSSRLAPNTLRRIAARSEQSFPISMIHDASGHATTRTSGPASGSIARAAGLAGQYTGPGSTTRKSTQARSLSERTEAPAGMGSRDSGRDCRQFATPQPAARLNTISFAEIALRVANSARQEYLDSVRHNAV